MSDDKEIGIGAGLTDIELGLRISYDLIERDFAPYIGVHYERKFGKTADRKIVNSEGFDNLHHDLLPFKYEKISRIAHCIDICNQSVFGCEGFFLLFKI